MGILIKKISNLFIGYIVIATLTGCGAYYSSRFPKIGLASVRDQEIINEKKVIKTPLARDIKETLPEEETETFKVHEPAGNITLSQVLTLVLMKNPVLSVFSKEIRAREAEIIQAGLLPNPELHFDSEDLANDRLRQFGDGPQIISSLSQVILLGGKRMKRVIAANLTRDLATWDYEVQRMNVLTQTSKNFTAMLNAQEKLDLAKQLMKLAEQVVYVVSKRVERGKTSPVEETKARVALSSVQVELIQAAQEFHAAKKRLAVLWGSTEPKFERAIGQLREISPIPSLEQLTQLIHQNPDLARWTTELAQRKAIVDLEKSEAIPDITVSIGDVLYPGPGDGNPSTNANGLAAGISIPLPVFNRNQGDILAAHHRLAKAKEAQYAARVQIVSDLSTAYQELASARAEAIILNTQTVPGAQSAFDAATRGFRLGKFDFLSVLNAQQTLFDSKAKYLQALTEYHQSIAEVERLIGDRLEVAIHL
ncbi:TolC family protein [Candidatus Nitrosacidococcus tergens]|uniref:Outer membrane efflux protein n=1 Tax=Candidatus Nitrosacidococcus tergens TaxID=553981 RepID=A0A7G1Q8W1_9GAMM|nr:TolC family protein [Candidatus Nitrosacidococcus tergens]CAB1275313.1 Outer membrane efflux protein [Candidatus Nitrosacidococcus tergens]